MKTPVLPSLFLLLSFLVFPAGAQNDSKKEPKSNEDRVRDYVAAYNDRKLDTMLEMVTADIEWLSIVGNKIAIESTGKAQLRKGMESYFKSTPSAQSKLQWVEATPTRVATLEKATWQAKTGEKSQVSLAIYEFRDQLISRVYYYPAEKPIEEQDPMNRKFRAITFEPREILRAWVIPHDKDMAEKRFQTQPNVWYIPELGAFTMKAPMRYKEAITFEELLQSKVLVGLDLSYLDLREDELARISKCPTLRCLHLSGVRLSDKMIDMLGQMGHLKYLNLFETNLSAKQLEELAARIPVTKIEAKKSDEMGFACDDFVSGAAQAAR